MNYFEMKVKSISENEKFVRNVVGMFVVPLNPTLDMLDDIKTAVSEAITNCVVHGYNADENGDIYIKVSTDESSVTISIEDKGEGIENLELALTPFYTTKPDDERSGMGFTLMQSFMDQVDVVSEVGKGTIVIMKKNLTVKENIDAWA